MNKGVIRQASSMTFSSKFYYYRVRVESSLVIPELYHESDVIVDDPMSDLFLVDSRSYSSLGWCLHFNYQYIKAKM